jgi:acyl-CoA thioester hydrolase
MSDLVTHRGTVFPWQCDHMGHMNVMWYVGKFDEASWGLLLQIGITPTYVREAQRGMAAVQQNLTYKRELHAGDVIEVRSRLLEVREKGLRFLHEMRNAERGELAASCELTTVHLDRVARKACAFPAEIRAAADDLLAQSARNSSDASP